MRPHLNKQAKYGSHTCHPSYSGNINKKVAIQAHLGKKKNMILSEKKLKQKGLGLWIK
jgi:hypothetical protein